MRLSSLFSYGSLVMVVLLVGCPGYPPPLELPFPNDPRILHGSWLAEAGESADYLREVAFSPDGVQLLVRGTFGLRRFATHDWRELPQLAETESIDSVVYSQDGQTLLTTSFTTYDDSSLEVTHYDAQTAAVTGRVEVPLPDGYGPNVLTAEAVVFLRPAPGDRVRVTRHELSSGKRSTFELSEPVYAFSAIDPGATRIVFAGDGTNVYDARTGTRLTATSLQCYSSSIALSADGRYLACACHGGGFVYDLTRNLRIELEDAASSAATLTWSLAFDAGGQLAVLRVVPAWLETGNEVAAELSLYRLDGVRQASYTTLLPGSQIPMLAFRSDGSQLVLGVRGQATVLDAALEVVARVPQVTPFTLTLELTAKRESETSYTTTGEVTLADKTLRLEGHVSN